MEKNYFNTYQNLFIICISVLSACCVNKLIPTYETETEQKIGSATHCTFHSHLEFHSSMNEICQSLTFLISFTRFDISNPINISIIHFCDKLLQSGQL